MDLGKAVELGVNLAIGPRAGVVGADFLEQGFHDQIALVLQPFAHPVAGLCGQFGGPAGGHGGDEAVGQGAGEERVGVGLAAGPFLVPEPVGGQPHFVAQPEVDLGDAAQAGEEDGVWAEVLADHAHVLPGQTREQVGAGPEVGGGAGGADEGLHRADAHGQQGGLAVFVPGEGAGKGGGQVEVVPDGVVGHAGIGGQQRPEQAQRAVVLLFLQFRAEAPVGEQAAFPVGVAVVTPDGQRAEMLAAALLDVADLGFGQASQVELLAGERVANERAFRPAHLGVVGHGQGLFLAVTGGDLDFLQWPLRPVGGGRPPVGALDGAVDGRGDPVEGDAIEGIFTRGEVVVAALEPEVLAQHPGGAALVPGGVAQEHQGLFRGVVQAGGELGLPEGGRFHRCLLGHAEVRSSPSAWSRCA